MTNIMQKRWGVTTTDRRLVGEFEPPAPPPGTPLFKLPTLPKLIEDPEVVVVIQRDQEGTREIARRLLADSNTPILLREGENTWIEPLERQRRGIIVQRPERSPDFQLRVRDRITHILCVKPPEGGELPIDDMLDRIARAMTRIDRLTKPGNQMASQISAAIGTEFSGMDAHRVHFADGSMVLMPEMSDQDFLQSVSLEVGSCIELPESKHTLIERAKSWWKRRRGK
jgi:hypothetical protein